LFRRDEGVKLSNFSISFSKTREELWLDARSDTIKPQKKRKGTSINHFPNRKSKKTKRTMQRTRCQGILPIRIGDSLHSRTAQIRIGCNHPLEQLLHAFRKLPLADPLAAKLEIKKL